VSCLALSTKILVFPLSSSSSNLIPAPAEYESKFTLVVSSLSRTSCHSSEFSVLPKKLTHLSGISSSLINKISPIFGSNVK
jgi:hypothetical protein